MRSSTHTYMMCGCNNDGVFGVGKLLSVSFMRAYHHHANFRMDAYTWRICCYVRVFFLSSWTASLHSFDTPFLLCKIRVVCVCVQSFERVASADSSQRSLWLVVSSAAASRDYGRGRASRPAVSSSFCVLSCSPSSSGCCCCCVLPKSTRGQSKNSPRAGGVL